MKVARLYLRVSTDEQDLSRQADIEHSTRAVGSSLLYLQNTGIFHRYLHLWRGDLHGNSDETKNLSDA